MINLFQVKKPLSFLSKKSAPLWILQQFFSSFCSSKSKFLISLLNECSTYLKLDMIENSKTTTKKKNKAKHTEFVQKK